MNNVIPIRVPKREASKQSSKFRFTVNRLSTVSPPESGSKYVYDSEIAGLALRVTDKGVKAYCLCRRLKGRPQRITLGRFESMTLADARRAAQQINGQAAAGIDVVEERKAARRRGARVSELFDSWLRSAKTRGLRTWQQDKRLWELHLAKGLGRIEAISLTTLDIQRLIERIGSHHHRTANKATALLSRIYGHALAKGLISGNNPVRGIERFPEASRERFLRPDELPKFVAAVMAEKEPWRAYFLILLYTGQRRAAVAAMRWQDLDIQTGVWHLPGWASKNKRGISVALTQEATDVLLQAKSDEINDWVFPSPVSKSGHIETPTKPWRRILKRAELSDLRIHDLRRTVGSWLAASGASAFIIQKALGHESIQSSQVYARLSVGPVRDAMSGITAGWASDDGTDN